MIPPIIPLGAVPVTSQLDPVRQTPMIPPVAPAQPAAGEPTLEFGQRDQQESALRLHEEFQRQHRRQQDHDEDEPGEELEDVEAHVEPQADAEYLPTPGYALNPDDTVPVVALIDNEPRRGSILDIQV